MYASVGLKKEGGINQLLYVCAGADMQFEPEIQAAVCIQRVAYFISSFF